MRTLDALPNHWPSVQVYLEAERTFFYPCPCGDKFFISLVSIGRMQNTRAKRKHAAITLLCNRPLILTLQDDLLAGEDIARCPSCSLRIRVVCDPEEVEKKFVLDAPPSSSSGGSTAVAAH